MSRPRCEARTEQGEPCRAFALESGRCWNHDPARSAERQAARSKGGKIRAIQGRRARLDSAGGLLRFMTNVVHGALDGTIEPDVVKAVTAAATLQTKLIEVANLERQVSELERLQSQRSRA